MFKATPLLLINPQVPQPTTLRAPPPLLSYLRAPQPTTFRAVLRWPLLPFNLLLSPRIMFKAPPLQTQFSRPLWTHTTFKAALL
jgi:hypothetical protein